METIETMETIENLETNELLDPTSVQTDGLGRNVVQIIHGSSSGGKMPSGKLYPYELGYVDDLGLLYIGGPFEEVDGVKTLGNALPLKYLPLTGGTISGNLTIDKDLFCKGNFSGVKADFAKESNWASGTPYCEITNAGNFIISFPNTSTSNKRGAFIFRTVSKSEENGETKYTYSTVVRIGALVNTGGNFNRVFIGEDYNKQWITLTGENTTFLNNIILTKSVNYGSSLPETGSKGQIFFLLEE